MIYTTPPGNRRNGSCHYLLLLLLFMSKQHFSPDFLYRRYPRVCLANRRCSHGVPTTDLDTLPGTVFSLDEQCELAYGENFTNVEFVGVHPRGYRCRLNVDLVALIPMDDLCSISNTHVLLREHEK